MTIAVPSRVVLARDIPDIDTTEARQLAHDELQRMLAVLDTLQGSDWDQPTACTEWSVKDMVAHLAGAWAGYATWRDWFRQYVFNVSYIMQANEPVDGINRRQVEDRTDRSPEQLIEELRAAGPKAINTRQGLPNALRGIKADIGAPQGKMPVGYLMDTIYTRDTWMHRHDICEAVDRPFEQTAEHDGRIVALIMRDLVPVLPIEGKTVDIHLTGAGGGVFRYGDGPEPDAVITMDVGPFHKMASRRLQPEDALAGGLVEIHGDRAFGEAMVKAAVALY